MLSILLLTQASLVYSQVSHCGGLSAIITPPDPIFPNLASAAHVEGLVIGMVTLGTTGDVVSVKAVSGPAMLVEPTMTALRRMKVNAYSGPRTCPFIITYRIAPKYEEPGTLPQPSDIQHIIVMIFNVEIADLVSLGKPKHTALLGK